METNALAMLLASPQANRLLDFFQSLEPEVNFGGSALRSGDARIMGYGGTARLGVPIGPDGARLDLSGAGQGMSVRAPGFQQRQSRLEGLGIGYTTPQGDRFSIDWHDRMIAEPDTLPGADPVELPAGMVPSRGLRFGWRREF